ncbi:hypothetical protein AVEN_27915-1 [Araneus ventricosus]|uniref:Uncharacterized protein n=1 Tax=Araneus ventricosus TaxID=182803 RepID=A0A4Y2HLH2_ARAVE|nr:hypothetical protein AVEN_27915-1 [Araneus ventricosus]
MPVLSFLGRPTMGRVELSRAPACQVLVSCGDTTMVQPGSGQAPSPLTGFYHFREENVVPLGLVVALGTPALSWGRVVSDSTLPSSTRFL